MTDKERLEEIEVKYSTLTVSSEKNGIEYTKVDVEDLMFLIQNGFKQADRVEELEMKLSINTNNMKQLQKENECYKQALEFYADEETYEPSEVQIGAVTKEGYKISKYKYDPIINADKGKKARKALKGE